MAASRQLVNISDDDLVKFSKENKNTAKRSEYHVRIFRKYLDTIQETRDITQMPFPDLQSLSEASHHSKIKFMSSRQRVISSIYFEKTKPSVERL